MREVHQKVVDAEIRPPNTLSENIPIQKFHAQEYAGDGIDGVRDAGELEIIHRPAMRFPGDHSSEKAGNEVKNIVNWINREQSQQAPFRVRQAGPMAEHDNKQEVGAIKPRQPLNDR